DGRAGRDLTRPEQRDQENGQASDRRHTPSVTPEAASAQRAKITAQRLLHEGYRRGDGPALELLGAEDQLDPRIDAELLVGLRERKLGRPDGDRELARDVLEAYAARGEACDLELLPGQRLAQLLIGLRVDETHRLCLLGSCAAGWPVGSRPAPRGPARRGRILTNARTPPGAAWPPPPRAAPAAGATSG